MKGGHKAVPRMPHTKTKGTKGTIITIITKGNRVDFEFF